MAYVRYLNDNPFYRGWDAQQDRNRQQRAQEIAEEQLAADQATKSAYHRGLQDIMQRPAGPGPAPGSTPYDFAPQQPMGGAQMQPAGVGAAPPMAGAGPGVGALQAQDPILRRLVEAGPAVAGAAYSRYTEQEAQSDKYMERAFDAIGAGTPEIAQYYARLAGRELPPGLLQATQQSIQFAAASKLASKFYGSSPQQAAAFVQAYVQSGGNLQAAVQAAGQPVTRTGARPTLQQIQVGEEQVYALFDSLSGTMRPVTTTGFGEEFEGQPAMPVPRVAGGAGSRSGVAAAGMDPKKVWLDVYLQVLKTTKNEATAREAADRITREQFGAPAATQGGTGAAAYAPIPAPMTPEGKPLGYRTYNPETGQLE